jgi:hypothetical protein
MSRNLKALGLALIAVFALSAVVASAASAQNGKLTSDGPVTLFGTQTGEAKLNAVSLFGGETTCMKAAYTAHKYNVTPHELIVSGESSMTITPNYGTCVWRNGGIAWFATYDMNGCDYALHLGTTKAASVYNTTTTIQCPVGQHITVTLFTTAAEHTAGNSFCHFTITEKAAGYPGLLATDTKNGKVDLTGTVENITAHKKGSEPVLCQAGETNIGKIALDITLEGKDKAGAATAISLSD